MRTLYLDASLVVSWAMSDPERAPRVLALCEGADRVISSEIVAVEAQSGLSAQFAGDGPGLLRAESRLNRVLAAMTLISVDSITLGAARSLVKRYRSSTGLRSLDAIHVATLGRVREASRGSFPQALRYATADRRQHATWVAEGYLGEFLE